MLRTALVLSFVVLAAPPPAASEEPAIRQAFEAYREALKSKDGAAAAKAVDADTLTYYGKVLELVLKGDVATVRKESLINRMMIIRLRHEVPVETLKKMGGRELLSYAVDKGWVSAKSVEKAELGKVKVTGDIAQADFLMGTQPTPYSFNFKKAADGWRFSLLPLLMIGEPALKQMAKKAGQDEDAFVFGLVEKVSGRPVPVTVWEPLVRPAKP